MNCPIGEVKRWVEKLVLNPEKPASISFISLRFARTDVATWMPDVKATARTPLLNISFEGFIQSSESVALDRLHQWIPDAIWNNIGGKLSRSVEYKNFCDANMMYEYCTLGSPAVDKGGRPKAEPSVCVATVRPDPCIQHSSCKLLKFNLNYRLDAVCPADQYIHNLNIRVLYAATDRC